VASDVDVKVSPTQLTGARKLFGRERELAMLDVAWDGGSKVVEIVAWGGVGKSALVNEWRNRLLGRECGVEWVFDWSFSVGVSVDRFLSEALRFFGAGEYADSPASPLEKGTRLAELVGGRRALLILDGLELLQDTSGSLREGSIADLLGVLAARNRGLCVVTTRVAVSELVKFESSSVHYHQLEHLSMEAGAALLQSLLEDGARPKPVKSTARQRAEIYEKFDGHALTLQLLGSYIRRAIGDVRGWQEIDFARSDAEQGGYAFRVMDAYVRWLGGEPAKPYGWLARVGAVVGWRRKAGIQGERQLAVLRLLGLFDRPAEPGCIGVLRRAPAILGLTESLRALDKEGWKLLVSSLEEMQLVTIREYVPVTVRGYDEDEARLSQQKGRLEEAKVWPMPAVGGDAMVLDAHPLVQKYFARKLQEANEAAWREGHRRLFEYLSRSVPYWPEEKEGLQPLYQAVAHGCSAGRMQEACVGIYRDRIQRGTHHYYSTHQLGAISSNLAAVSSCFERPWDWPSNKLTEAARSWVVSEAAFSLHALGRLSEALEPRRACLKMEVERGDWSNAAITASILSELELTLGRTSTAVEAAVQSVAHADRSEDDFHRMASRTTLADARHQLGDLAGASELFEQAEAMQAASQPAYPQLYSLGGYRYADLLLSPAERAAWRAWLGETTHEDELVTRCAEVFARATQRLASPKPRALIDNARDHLTLGRAALYARTLAAPTQSTAAKPSWMSLFTALKHFDGAVALLRKAGWMDDLPRGLIARAHLHHLDGRPDLARADLDEAWAIAERGPMPLHQADIQLTRARLFHDRDALAEARTLITRHEYNRRLPELADAEQAAQSWPDPTRATVQPMPSPLWDPALCPDVAILIALPEEFRTLAAEYATHWQAQPNPNHPGSDFLFVGPGGYRCVASIMPSMGPTVASQVSARLLASRPAVLINVGIAGGFKDDLRIGDVIAPSQVDAYDQTGKFDTHDQWERRGKGYTPTPALLAHVHELEFIPGNAFTAWRKAGEDQLTALRTGADQARIDKLLQDKLLRDKPLLSTNHLASGSFVVASKPFAEFIRQANANIHAGEMEAAGMLAAAEYWSAPVQTLVVRGISDHVDADKRKVDEIGEGALRRLAMANAWRLVTTLMQLGKLPRSPGVDA
jgi:nucleoside phosphorylase